MIIIDKSFKPYIIKVTSDSYDLYKIVKVKEGDNKGMKREINKGYFTSLDVLKFRLAKLIVLENNQNKEVSSKKFSKKFKATYALIDKTLSQ